MSERASSAGDTTTAEPVPVAVKPARCLRCASELSLLPLDARYCPRCGLHIHSAMPTALSSWPMQGRMEFSELLTRWNQLAQQTTAHDTDAPQAVVVDCQDRSDILQGYANALYKLGLRYEAGGAGGNPREAIRCYCKSARLGNLLALARLSSSWLWGKGLASRGADQHAESAHPAD